MPRPDVPHASRPTLLVAAPLAIEAFALRGGAPDVRVVRAGMGPRRAARSAQRLAHEPAAAFAVAGVCGALSDEFEPGDLVVASALVDPGGERIEVDGEALAAALARAGLRVHRGAIACVARLRDGYPRAELARRTGACAVDMESFWLARAAAGRPFAVLRAVSDGPRHEFLRPAIITQGIAALRKLREAAPILAAWAASEARSEPEASEVHQAGEARSEPQASEVHQARVTSLQRTSEAH